MVDVVWRRNAIFFRETIEDMGLVDITPRVGWFTWNNKCTGDCHIASRLDHFLVSESVINLGSEIHSSTLSSRGSDHWPTELLWSGLGSQFKNPFHFEHFWMIRTDFNEKFKTWWAELHSNRVTNMWYFQQNLKALKSKIKKWNKEEFGNIFQEKSRLEIRLQEI